MGLAPRQVPTECSMSSAKKQTAKAAFEIKKGTRQVMTLIEAEVEKYLELRELLNGLEDGFRGIELGEIQSPPRPKLSVAGMASGHANYGENCQRLRWQCGYRDLPNHLALINLFDPGTGATSCVMDGTYITGIRTATSAVLSARMLSRNKSRIATVIGAGIQGREPLRLLPLLRDLERVNMCSLRFEDAQKLESGAHVSSVGYCPPDGEVPKEPASEHHLFVGT